MTINLKFDEIIDPQGEAGKLDGIERNFAASLKQVSPGDAAVKLVDRFKENVDKYEESAFVKYTIGMVMAYLDGCKQPEREWRDSMIRYEISAIVTKGEGLPDKLKSALQMFH
jgi:hypothetical protein